MRSGDIKSTCLLYGSDGEAMKFKTLFLSLLIVGLVLVALGSRSPSTQAQTLKQKGLSYFSWEAGQLSRPDADLALINLKSTGTNWISLIVTGMQDTITSTTIYTTTAIPTDADLIHAITRAHSLGLKVMLKPHLGLTYDPTHWVGEIGQGFTEAQWAAWFSSYQAFITHYAQLAQDYGADQFCVGNDLSNPQKRTHNWRTVVASVRSRYSGPITYAPAYDATDLTWWDAVDYIGVNAYYPLTNKNDPTLVELKAAWQPYVTTLAQLASTWNKPILFTEIGYCSQNGANQHPWDWQVTGTVDLQEQVDTYRAAFESVFDQPWFAGMYWWSWGTDPFEGGPCDDGYTPHDKPAEEVLRSWYEAPPHISPVVPPPDYSRTIGIYRDGLGSGWGDWSWGATINLLATSPVYSGTRAISVSAEPWGTLSLYHPSFDSGRYYWLEFYIRESSSTEKQFRVFANDENDTELRYLPICRYLEGGVIEPGVWKRVRIPLTDLNAAGRFLQRVSIRNFGDEPSLFWVDEIRLVAATRRVYLPVVIRSSL